MNETLITRRGYLILRGMSEAKVPYPVASEAVASVAIEHPEWDMDEKRTWTEWNQVEGR